MVRARDRIRRVNLLLFTLRWLAAIQVAGVLFQAVCAGQFLAGFEDAVRLHEVGGWTILALSIVQLAGAILLTVRARGTMWIPLCGAAILLSNALQVGTGYGRFPSVHVPLGVLVFGVAFIQAALLFREPSGRIP